MEFLEIGDQEIAADRVGGRDVQLTGRDNGVVQELVLSPHNQIDGRLYMFEEDFPGWRQGDLLGGAEEELLIQLFLQGLDGL